MRTKLTRFRNPISLGIFLLCLVMALFPSPGRAQQPAVGYVVVGQLLDPLGQPVVEARVAASLPGSSEPLAESESLEDGSFDLLIETLPALPFEISITRAHFQPQTIQLSPGDLEDLRENRLFRLDPLTLDRRITPGFWVATLVFLGVILMIAFEKLHATTAALAGLTIILLTSSVAGSLNPDFFIFSFERSLHYINWEVILLVMGMMIIIAIIEGTGIFQWMAFQAYRMSRGKSWLLALILMTITAVASAMLDNFTTMLLMTPISLQIGIALGINPLALIIPEVLASNVGGISTLVGTPTNILIGAYAGIGFNDFLINQTGGVLIALIGMAAFVLFYYRKEFRKRSAGISPKLYAKLQENAQLEDRDSLWKSGLVFGLVLVGFVVGDQFNMVPAVPALAGATLMLIWLKPDVHKMITAVDWTTLVFFMALFIVVGAIQEVGLLGFIAAGMSRMIGANLPLGIFIIVFGVGTLSTAIANIPLTASMLPIIKFLTASIPGANSLVLYYALSMGAAMGGNGLLIGGEANLVTAGITAQTDSPISFSEFLKIGLPTTYITLTLGFLWLLIRF